MTRPDEFNNLRQFQIRNVIAGVLEEECVFCGESLLGDHELTESYVEELIQANGPLTAAEIIEIITCDFEDGCCDHCSHFLQDD